MNFQKILCFSILFIKFPYILIKSFLVLSFARSWMRRNSHVQFCNRDGIENETSIITPKEQDSVNNIEEE